MVPRSLQVKSLKCKIVCERHTTNNARRRTKMNGNRSTECCAILNADCLFLWMWFSSLVDLEQKGVTSKLKNIKHYLVIILTENLWYWNLLLSIDWYVFLLNRKYKILHILHRKQSRRYMYEIIYCTLESNPYERHKKLEFWDNAPTTET